MNKAFNLLDEPWMPVCLADGHVVNLGLLEVFSRSGEIVGLAETAPPSLVAQYRLLLAVLHRALSLDLEHWETRDRVRWFQQGLPVAAVHAYLERWRERFWLFDSDFPFMQVATLATAEETRGKCKPWTQISLASASGNTPVVFDHAYDEDPSAVPPADILRTLLGFLAFTPGGLVRTFRDADKAGALVNTAAVIPLGQCLAQTLVLGLHAPSRKGAEPDLPAWERGSLTVSELRGEPVLATGPNDRYTRQSRAVLFLPEEDYSVRWLRFAAGWALGEDNNMPDPMAAFRAGSIGLVRLTFTEGRSLWRDLPALLPNPGQNSCPPVVLKSAGNLHQKMSDDWFYQPLLIAGLASDQAKLLRWRSEQISLPVVLIEHAERAEYLRILVGRAEDLFREISKLAISMLAETLPDPMSKDTRSRARAVLEAGPFSLSYFSAAERALPGILQALGEGKFEWAGSYWNAALRESAILAWERVVSSLGYSSRALRADAKLLQRFYGLLNKQVPKTNTPLNDKESVA